MAMETAAKVAIAPRIVAGKSMLMIGGGVGRFA